MGLSYISFHIFNTGCYGYDLVCNERDKLYIWEKISIFISGKRESLDDAQLITRGLMCISVIACIYFVYLSFGCGYKFILYTKNII